MTEIKDVEFYEYEGLGYVIDPASETKIVFIPSPPTQTETKINPRAVVIYVTGGKITESYEKLDELKAYCKDNKIVFVCPNDTDDEVLSKTYTYICKNFKSLNVKLNCVTIKADPDHMTAAQEFIDYIVDELDGELENDEPEEFEL